MSVESLVSLKDTVNDPLLLYQKIHVDVNMSEMRFNCSTELILCFSQSVDLEEPLYFNCRQCDVHEVY